MSNDDMYDAISDFFISKKYSITLPNLQIGAFYRASKLGAGESHKPELQRIECTLKKFAGQNRCNWQGEPIFYCSNENGVPFFEVRTEKDSVVAMTTWVSKDCLDDDKESFPISISPIVIGLDKVIATFGDNNNTLKRYKTEHYEKNVSDDFKRIDNFLGEKFAENDKDFTNIYKFTSSVARTLYSMAEKTSKLPPDGLMYPSIQSKFTGINLALTNKFVTDNLRIQGSAIYFVKDYDPIQPSYSMVALRGLYDLDSSKKAVWRNVHPDDADKRFELSPETEAVYDLSLPRLNYED